MDPKWIPWWLLVLLLIAGCDPNPDAPLAPSLPSQTEPSKVKTPVKGKPKVTPLRQVGEPIGASDRGVRGSGRVNPYLSRPSPPLRHS